MTLGLSLAAFTAVHVAISLVGIVAGFVVVAAMCKSRHLAGWAAVFLVTTTLTSATGFGFPFDGLKPSHVFGVLSLIVLAPTIAGLYQYHIDGRWRPIYVIGSIFALYLNTFVLVVQSFLKVPFLAPLAPTQSEPPFAVAQLAVLVLCVVLGWLAVRAFRPSSGAPVPSMA